MLQDNEMEISPHYVSSIKCGMRTEANKCFYRICFYCFYQMFLFLTILSADVLDSKENIFFNDELRVLMEVD